ncbi:MAG: energy transducer TonB [Gemmatimonadota bacterium]|nr:energy transducer TonB [Gemmatimonadota bacterium]
MSAPEPANPSIPLTANQRFKHGSPGRTGVGLLGAVAVHVGLLMVVQPFEIQDLAAAEEEELRVVIPDVSLPAPPPEIPRPSLPVVGDLSIDPDRTIAVVPFREVELLPVGPPPVAAETTGVRFIPYDTAPALQNEDEVARALRREYPSTLRRTGVEGQVVLWMYVDEEGQVTMSEVMRSSGTPALDEAALRVAGRMRFSPALNRDRPTAVWVQQLVTFRIR